ncbi:MAG: hypothetical protein JW942_07705 [Opitutales bacterium]|nr:hypothetical protein [Opitutales bacterium]
MDTAALALSQISTQMALTQSQVQVSMVKQQHNAQQQMIALITQSAQASPVASAGTGAVINTYA